MYLFLGSEHQVWGFSDEARAELPLDADDNEAEPSVVGSVWNFNSQAQVTVAEKTTKAPNLMVLSSLGVLVVFQLYNFNSGYTDMTQLTETMPDSGENLEDFLHLIKF